MNRAAPLLTLSPIQKARPLRPMLYSTTDQDKNFFNLAIYESVCICREKMTTSNKF
jgi:hypothetical protein